MSHSALIVTELKAPLKLVSRPTPEPKEGEILVQVKAAGFNPHDGYARESGLFISNSLPTPMAVDTVGIITKIGPGVSAFAVGDRVMGVSNPSDPDSPSTQEFATLSAALSANVPSRLNNEEASTVTLNPFTAFVALFTEQGFNLPAPFHGQKLDFDYARETIVLIGGGSACGKYSTAFAKLAGFGKIVVVASQGKDDALLKTLGATHIVDRHQSSTDLEQAIRDIGGDEIVYVLDCVGRGTDQTLGARFLSSKKKGILAVLVGAGSVDEDQIGRKEAGYERRGVKAVADVSPEVRSRYWKEVALWIDEGVILPTPYSVIEGLDEAKVNEVFDAYRDGKPLVKPTIRL